MPRVITDTIDAVTSASERDGRGKLSLRNMPTPAQRDLLSARQRELVAAVHKHDKKAISLAVGRMVAVYDAAQTKRKTKAEAQEVIAVYVLELVGVPTWAVDQACSRIRMGTVPNLGRTHMPTPIEVRAFAVSIALPWKTELLQIGEILRAPEYRDAPDDEERGRVAIKMRLLADELKTASEARVEAERADNTASLRRHAERGLKSIRDHWKSLGQEPKMAGDVMLSPALVASITGS